jgi:hypothetical protein
MKNTKYDIEKMIELEKKLTALTIEREQRKLGLDGLELVRYGTGENDPENDQGLDFYTRRIDTKEVIDTGVNIDEIIVSDLMQLLKERTSPLVQKQIVWRW